MDKDNNKLEIEKNNGWIGLNDKEKKNIFDFCDKYINFLNKSKTERMFIKNAIELLENNGYKNILDLKKISIGDKVYFNNHNKALYAANITADMFKGLNIIGSHVDSPRIDLKPMPLYEDSDMAFFKTQYYGGIKKYQWTSIPLVLKGTICLTNGENLDISIGEEDNEPIFTIPEILVHLSMEQMQKKGNRVVEGEELNILVGNMALSKDENVKLNILKILNEKYGIKEKDFTSSELEFVPAFNAKTAGLDLSLVAGYGQDDKVCSYANLIAFIESKEGKTKIMILSDKEEVGSMGNTGMESQLFDMFIDKILNLMNVNYVGAKEEIYYITDMLSADVDGGYDPTYASCFDKNNSTILGQGVVLNKYTGSGGKGNASDANAEYVRDIRKLFEENNIKYQVTAMGKIDLGGGGTIAYILANKGINVIDCGIGLLSMHSPYEVASKFDIFEMYKGYTAFYNK